MHNNDRKEQIQAIKDRANIVEVVSEFERLKKRGRNYICKCPFHNENSASFSVSPIKGIFKCFGCGAGGNAVDFIMKHEKLEFPDAIKWLGDFYRLPIDESTPRTYTRPFPMQRKATTPPLELEISYIPKEAFNKSLSEYQDNNFVQYLFTLFTDSIVNKTIDKYYIGTSKYYPGGVVFWQIDEIGNVRTGKIMPYNPLTGKRIREQLYNSDGRELPASNWAHSVLKLQNFNLTQSMFGLQLLGDESNLPIAIVESEKTAIIASVFLPQYVWMATGLKGFDKFAKDGSANEVPLSMREKFKPLAGREVILFPDLGAYDDWCEMALQLSDIADIKVNNLLQEIAKGYNLPAKGDIADFLTSDKCRRELIDSFKYALINAPDNKSNTQIAIWLEYSDRGLRRSDRRQAYLELQEAGTFEFVADNEIHPYYYDENIKPPIQQEQYK